MATRIPTSTTERSSRTTPTPRNTGAASFAFGFRIEGIVPDPASGEGAEAVSAEDSNAGVLVDAGSPRHKEEEEEENNECSSGRSPFAWIPPSEVLELWVRRRQSDIAFQTVDGLALPRNPQLPLQDDGTVTDGTEENDELTLLRHVVLRDEMEDEGKDEINRDPPSSPLGSAAAAAVLQSGVYEGGAAVWECSLDLVQYLKDDASIEDRLFGGLPAMMAGSDSSPENELDSDPVYVLELGCGHALPSCLLLRQSLLYRRRSSNGMRELRVAMVDYNRSVVENVTLPNVLINTAGLGADAEQLVRRTVALGSGDWMDLSRQLLQQRRNTESDPRTECDPPATVDATDDSAAALRTLLPPDGRFDLILAAETLYTTQAAAETAHFVRRHLRRDSRGIALVASKRYYFGVGGGVDDFRESLLAGTDTGANDDDDGGGGWDTETVREVDTGVGNIREIVRVTAAQS